MEFSALQYRQRTLAQEIGVAESWGCRMHLRVDYGNDWYLSTLVKVFWFG
jgi:hypothetical protein